MSTMVSHEEDACEAVAAAESEPEESEDDPAPFREPSNCAHDWEYVGHGHNYSLFRCPRCHAEEER